MEIEILHTSQGDKKKKIDTSTDAGKAQAQALIEGMLKDRTAIFLERGKKTYRVKGYDVKNDRLIVGVAEKNVKADPKKGKATAVPPVAGG